MMLKIAAFLFLATAAQLAVADEPTTSPSAAHADNTGVNERDRNDATLTPMDQAKGSKRDVELTRKIRQLVVKEKKMSSDAKNVKIITLAGKATLRGPVNNLEEKNRIGALASSVAGVVSVDNQLEVKASN